MSGFRSDNGNERQLGAKGEATRQRLLDAAEEVFGTKSFYQASIGDITALAGVAQGTFYLYFKSKNEIFRELVIQISHLVRQATELAAADATSRLDAERLGMEAYHRFIDKHRNIYRILRQCEFVDLELYKWYYRRIAQGYTRKLAQAMEAGEIRKVDPEAAAWALMGISSYTGLRYVLWEDSNKTPTEALAEFFTHGLAPDKGSQ